MRRIFLDGDVFADYLQLSCDFIAGEKIETPKVVYGCVLYGTPLQIEDQNGRPMASCHDDAGMALTDAMQKNLMPIFQKGFLGSNYKPMMFTNLGQGNDFPFLSIMRTDSQGFMEEDMTAVNTLLRQIILENNQKVELAATQEKGKRMEPTLFRSVSDKAKVQQYETRSKQSATFDSSA